MYKKYFKRCIDFTIAFLALAIIGWFILLVAIMLHFANKGAGAFFLQERPGKDGKPFKVMKFKTMTDERGADGELLPDVQRITKIGKLVRSLSIDELPQFINVFKGDMSLIGPRPLLMHYLPWYSPEQARRHEVRPGITGWAQVNGRNHCKLSKKFELDVWYVDHCTLATDLKICKMTILNIIKREDVGEGTGNMEEVDDLGFHQRYLELLEQRKKND
jgi:lipopolysaccharide/colanic/teichoic acid biosynthesis glycosyltransferase